jgi:predicted DNA binding CopG/RHH family protein
MKPVQYFTDEYLEQSKSFTTESVLEFLENFRLMQMPEEKSKLISMKIPVPLLNSFRAKCELHGIKYQTQIKELMIKWVKDQD